MLNILWAAMIFAGIIFGIATGRGMEVNNAVLEGGKSAVTIGMSMAGIVAVWSGIMKIAEKGGIIDSLSERLMPVLRRLFREIPEGSPAFKYISANFTANFLGLGWAATPAGLEAMRELDKLNGRKKTASDSMCMFMIINMSSIQLITVSVIAYRKEFGSVLPADIIFPSIAATAVSTGVAVICAKICEKRSFGKWKP